jgi:hypothetical protein
MVPSGQLHGCHLRSGMSLGPVVVITWSTWVITLYGPSLDGCSCDDFPLVRVGSTTRVGLFSGIRRRWAGGRSELSSCHRPPSHADGPDVGYYATDPRGLPHRSVVDCFLSGGAPNNRLQGTGISLPVTKLAGVVPGGLRVDALQSSEPEIQRDGRKLPL